MPVLTYDTLYNYETCLYKISYIYNKLLEENDNNDEEAQAALLGLRDAIDKDFDFEKNINWDLVSEIDYSGISESSTQETE